MADKNPSELNNKDGARKKKKVALDNGKKSIVLTEHGKNLFKFRVFVSHITMMYIDGKGRACVRIGKRDVIVTETYADILEAVEKRLK